MRLTKFTDLSLRIVMRLAAAGQDELLTTREAAEQLAVPYTHAAKAVHRLAELGVVDARRGRGGGLALSTSAEAFSVGWLARELEGVGDVVGCDDAVPCPLRTGCRLRGALRRAQEAFYAVLDELTIADLVAGPTGPLLLSLPAPAHHRPQGADAAAAAG
ncbi:Rrf2 family transcriptional regulator [Streptacidiphilus sp. ASG 303]|uniref:RrF2 family transcriptional regulator n=1 Tax=Streptomycetaceae TaxID=2062 RepID=UPI001E299B41|nr:Rrf2 family transcriptional regulator [Streptacidiphilus sp. ASG 303]MCD0484777.1 Rrf2 family transcriptional regulator [Streptacidiphilus sp. ASG 303]